MIETTMNTAPPTGDTPEHIAAMTARADGEAPPVVEDALLAGKYKTQEELITGYLELQKAFSSGERAPAEPVVEPPVEPVVDASVLPEAAAEAGVNDIDFARYSQTVNENGTLGDTDYAELEAKGLPKPVVDAYIDGLKASADNRTSAVVDAVGGQESFDAIREWTATGLTEAEHVAFQGQLDSAKSTEEVSVVYQTLKTRYAAANPTEPTLLAGDGKVNAVNGYPSEAQLMTDMQDPRYAKDPAFRAQVASKLKASKLY